MLRLSAIAKLVDLSTVLHEKRARISCRVTWSKPADISVNSDYSSTVLLLWLLEYATAVTPLLLYQPSDRTFLNHPRRFWIESKYTQGQISNTSAKCSPHLN